jgi:hypothetical protein
MSIPIVRKTPNYVLENGSYAFYLGEQRLFTTGEVAILFDRISGTLHKHGLPENVAAEATKMRQAYLAVGAVDMAADCVVMQGRFELDDLNQAVHIVDYAGRLYRKLQATGEPVPVLV